ncbi:TetR/AcrR family transcriptional regulator [Microbacterium sp. MPKO10]|uniref:TetR/AcrR family transcriptional regulator n=1 Tax=Microbacterium sp. MPKO10 TaxID=2989818 RepID=UPI0022368BD7|nr:TetR/AcrR family transcriptional regulator [Microbacterium sp. MPKO10]MCW4457050.1 TetR/AcrR family transcriptional regulator [Microbacterium sp. MPKO10]
MQSSFEPERPLRADAQHSIARILEAAEKVFVADPRASLEDVARAAGVARTTVHRRFVSRDDLHDALVATVNRRLREALDKAEVATAPPLVALYQLTVVTLELKVDWRASWQLVDFDSTGARGIDPSAIADLDLLLRRSRDAGLLQPDVDAEWARGIYLALIHEASARRRASESASQSAYRVMKTLLVGLGNPEHDLESLLSRPANGRDL